MTPVTLEKSEDLRLSKNVKHIKVGSDTRIESLTKCITSEYKRGKKLVIDCVGSSSITRACKAIAESSNILQSEGLGVLSPTVNKSRQNNIDVITFIAQK